MMNDILRDFLPKFWDNSRSDKEFRGRCRLASACDAEGDSQVRAIMLQLPRRPPAAQRRPPRRGVRSQARRHLPLPPRGGRW
jgi:hypothetical protein